MPVDLNTENLQLETEDFSNLVALSGELAVPYT
jgi:hypothetical protein